MHQPLISIIITILNGAETISQCLASIAHQTFIDYELVVVDGGSKDRTVELVKASLIQAKTVQVIPGIGLYAGLNAGINLSTGKWLYFIGADDELYSDDTLQKVAEFINAKRNETEVLVGSVACLKQDMLLRPLFGSPYMMRHQVHHQGMFYSKHIFDDALYNETMRIASDYEFNLELSLKGVAHEAMGDLIVCNFGGDGVSENQMKRGFAEMQRVHHRLFKGVGRPWAMSYFWLRRRTGALLRLYNLKKVSTGLKKAFG